MKYDFSIKSISEYVAVDFIQKVHYSKVMPRLTKHFLGCFYEDELVGVLTLGWGTQPKQTISKLFPSLESKDYYEIGKMGMLDKMPKNSETQMLSNVIRWMKTNCPEKLFLFTWADGIMGKPGYGYQAFNFLYGGYIWTPTYISNKGEKIHSRSTKRLCEENVVFEKSRNKDFFKNRKAEKIFWLTQDFLDVRGIKKYLGKQFRYILPLNNKAKKLIKESTVEWTKNYPKSQDLIWRLATKDGFKECFTMPEIDGNIVEYNKINVDKFKSKSISLFN